MGLHLPKLSVLKCNTAVLAILPWAGHFGHKTLRHRDNSAPQNWCGRLSRITGGAVSHRNCPGSKCPGFSSITARVSKCLVPRFWCRSVLRSVPKCPRVSWCRSVLWPKCPVTILPAASVRRLPTRHGWGRRHLWSADVHTCAVPRTQTRLGDRSFAVVGPRLWNNRLNYDSET